MTIKTRNEVSKLIQRKFGHDLPIVEAKKPLRLQPLPIDGEGATPQCPDNCLLVHTAQRMFGSKAAVFWRGAAYIDLLNEDGIRQVERFVIPACTNRQIIDFDAGKPFTEGRGLLLLPPSPSKSRKGMREQSKKYQGTPNYRALHNVDNARRALHRAELNLENKQELFAQIKRAAPSTSPKLVLLSKDLCAARAEVENKRNAFIKAQKIADKLREPNNRKRQQIEFDITTRNGAKGLYHFVHVK